MNLVVVVNDVHSCSPDVEGGGVDVEGGGVDVELDGGVITSYLPIFIILVNFPDCITNTLVLYISDLSRDCIPIDAFVSSEFTVKTIARVVSYISRDTIVFFKSVKVNVSVEVGAVSNIGVNPLPKGPVGRYIGVGLSHSDIFTITSSRFISCGVEFVPCGVNNICFVIPRCVL